MESMWAAVSTLSIQNCRCKTTRPDAADQPETKLIDLEHADYLSLKFFDIKAGGTFCRAFEAVISASVP
jgi:hypothetical protein